MDGVHPKLATGLGSRIKAFRQNGTELWSRVVTIAENLGKKDVSQGSGHTSVSYEVFFNHDATFCRIHKSNYVMGGDYVNVSVDGNIVLDVGECDAPSCTNSGLEKACKIKLGSQWYKLAAYIPGPWEAWLNFDEIKTQLDAKHTRASRVRQDSLQKVVESRPLTRQEDVVARSFGITPR